jgi:hypothetical protein
MLLMLLPASTTAFLLLFFVRFVIIGAVFVFVILD